MGEEEDWGGRPRAPETSLRHSGSEGGGGGEAGRKGKKTENSEGK